MIRCGGAANKTVDHNSNRFVLCEINTRKVQAAYSPAAQSNLAFLGMWRCSTRPDLAELLPFDADAGSSSNMVSSQPGRTLGLQSWAGGRLGANFYGVREKRGGRVVDLRI